ncbi:MAG: hypothetical protein FXF49_02655 [Flexistipes sinusarabici]|uniref:Uncharacterized protein n=1 Tax=Flexistipes sinusarabici TaxID=2352 RepID=A0A5D0MR40_FLESI|nr:hypothetical protein [Flexistipes sinusarabici]TYB34241.1 MAG: hypothetical protein FXF49_02655 [Flexistipes sinusarabici]
MVERIKDYVCNNGFCDCYVSISPEDIEKHLSGFRKFSFFFFDDISKFNQITNLKKRKNGNAIILYSISSSDGFGKINEFVDFLEGNEISFNKYLKAVKIGNESEITVIVGWGE